MDMNFMLQVLDYIKVYEEGGLVVFLKETKIEYRAEYKFNRLM